MATDPIKVHRLRPGETELLRDLNAMFADAFEDANYASRPPTTAYLERALSCDATIALVAIDRGRVVGGLTAYELVKLEQPRSEVYIYDLAVAAAYRRRGIATGLIDAVRRIAAEHGADVVYVQADLGDDAAIALYSRLGRRQDVLHFDMMVD